MPINHQSSGALVGGGAWVAVDSEPQQFIFRAQGLYAGLRTLVPLVGENAQAAIFLASWCLELTLKAFLSTKGQGKRELREIQHNLGALWERAAELGLSVEDAPPGWCQLLGATYDYPYHQRYPTETCASIAPNLELVTAELESLLALVERSTQ